ncbi:NAD(P)-dependent alcohol dehydrogenase [Actinoplanes aureus]|uniref:NAD(P)-dependent alcohol dehydrogenase n=1 Tax=Actinoplanes aureus TaxID=2792083 RepID=A0A931CAV5_9ACTN|nr:NAD(P)-dependent alcohol dehydrogenase [Actinoplanes aureus]MBG0564007.1 NAD(P)-dependent alcohol dehydrogenase [Actinoplanes aureus]
MKALVQLGYGTPGRLALRDVGTPVPRSGEVLVRVHAAGLNAADRLMLRGDPFAIRAAAGGLRRPRRDFVTGRAFAGRVESVGSGVEGLRVGDEVFAEGTGAIAEFARVRARLAAPKPAGMTFIEAAALPVGGTTALQGVRDALRVRPGQKILITGASGGVGTFAVEIAADLGAHVTASCAGRNAELMKSIGAEAVVDYEKQATPGEGFDAILDLAGNYPLPVLRKALAPGGLLSLSVGTGGHWLGPARRILAAKLTGRRASSLVARLNRDDLSALAALVVEKRVRPVIDRVYPLAEAVAAMDQIDRGRVAGKVVVTVAE